MFEERTVSEMEFPKNQQFLILLQNSYTVCVGGIVMGIAAFQNYYTCISVPE